MSTTGRRRFVDPVDQLRADVRALDRRLRELQADGTTGLARASAVGPGGGAAVAAEDVVVVPAGGLSSGDVQAALVEHQGDVEDRVRGQVRLTVSDTPPPSPAVGDLWVDTT